MHNQFFVTLHHHIIQRHPSPHLIEDTIGIVSLYYICTDTCQALQNHENQQQNNSMVIKLDNRIDHDDYVDCHSSAVI